MQKTILLFIGFIVVSLAQAMDLPEEFTLTQKIFALTTTFELKDDGTKLGKVSKHMVALTPTYTLKDKRGNKIATAKRAMFSWGAKVDVYDPKGKKIGTIKEQIFKSLFKWRTVYSVYDGSGKKVAESEKLAWLTTKFRIYDRKDNLVMKMDRPVFRLVDTWNVSVIDDSIVDTRVLLMIPVYKSDMDNERKDD